MRFIFSYYEGLFYLSVVTCCATGTGTEPIQGALIVPLTDGFPDDVTRIWGGARAGDKSQVFSVTPHLMFKDASVCPSLGEILQTIVRGLVRYKLHQSYIGSVRIIEI